MVDNELQRRIDISIMRVCHTSIEGLPKDIEAIADRIRKIDPSLKKGDCSELVLNFIRSSEEILYLAKEKSTRMKKPENVWGYHLSAFKQYEQDFAWRMHREDSKRDCDSNWYLAQDKIAETVLSGSYEKVETPGFELD